MIKNIFIAALVALLVSVGVVYVFERTSPSLGADAGPSHYNFDDFLAGFQTEGNIIQNGPNLVAVLNNLILGAAGFNGPFATSTALTPAQFCATTNQRWLGTSGTATETLPAATSSWLACGAGAFGAWNANWVTNDSTNTVNVVAGPGMKFKCESNGVGTTTIVGGCTVSQVSLPASTTVDVNGFWDGASNTMYINWGNMYY